jgi:hypothetical protein
MKLKNYIVYLQSRMQGANSKSQTSRINYRNIKIWQITQIEEIEGVGRFRRKTSQCRSTTIEKLFEAGKTKSNGR